MSRCPTARCALCLGGEGLGPRHAWVHEHPHDGRLWDQLAKQPELLRPLRTQQAGHAGNVATGSVETGDEAQPHGVFSQVDHEGNFRGCRLGRQRRRLSAGRDNDSNLPAYQLLGQRLHAAVLAASPAVFDGDVLPFDVARFAQAPTDCGQHRHVGFRRSRAEISDYRHRRLLRARPERPCRSAAEQCDDLATFQPSELQPSSSGPGVQGQHNGIVTIKSGVAALRDFDPAYRRFGSKRESPTSGLA